MMLNCREVTRLLASGEADGAPAVRRILIRLHLMMCDDCHRYAAELRHLGDAAREALRLPLAPSRLAALERAIVERAQSGDDLDPDEDKR